MGEISVDVSRRIFDTFAPVASHSQGSPPAVKEEYFMLRRRL